MNWWETLEDNIRLNVALAEYTTFKIGGPARFFVEPGSVDDLQIAVRTAKKQKLPIFVLGAGSNVLVADRGVRGVVIRLSSRYFKKCKTRDHRVHVGSGLPLGHLLRRMTQEGFSGFEFLAGIPGSVGGALAMNAGAWGKSIGELVEKVEVMDYNGTIRVLPKTALRFTYRSSNLSRYIILSTVLQCKKSTVQEAKNKIAAFLRLRRDTQGQRFPNAGCIFKNPHRKSAGKLIEACGLKGKHVGGACVSLRHANFILNQDNARADEVLKLMSLIQKKVKQKFGVSLKPEIRLWK